MAEIEAENAYPLAPSLLLNTPKPLRRLLPLSLYCFVLIFSFFFFLSLHMLYPTTFTRDQQATREFRTFYKNQGCCVVSSGVGVELFLSGKVLYLLMFSGP